VAGALLFIYALAFARKEEVVAPGPITAVAGE
jgi:hypothetical protein